MRRRSSRRWTREAVDRAQRVGLEGDHHARVTDRLGEVLVPLHRAPVLGHAAGQVAAAAGAALVAHHDHQRHRAGLVALHAVEEAAHLLLHARAGEAAEPAEAGLAGEPPDRVGLVGLPGALPARPLHVGRLHAVDEVLGAHERVGRGRVRGAHVEVARVDLRRRAGCPARTRPSPRGTRPADRAARWPAARRTPAARAGRAGSSGSWARAAGASGQRGDQSKEDRTRSGHPWL